MAGGGMRFRGMICLLGSLVGFRYVLCSSTTTPKSAMTDLFIVVAAAAVAATAGPVAQGSSSNKRWRPFARRGWRARNSFLNIQKHLERCRCVHGQLFEGQKRKKDKLATTCQLQNSTTPCETSVDVCFFMGLIAAARMSADARVACVV